MRWAIALALVACSGPTQKAYPSFPPLKGVAFLSGPFPTQQTEITGTAANTELANFVGDPGAQPISWIHNYYYTTLGATLPPGVEFVPSIFNPSSTYQNSTSLAACAAAHVCLGYNEPDNQSPAYTVAQCAAAWPALVATGARLGCPVFNDNPSSTNSKLDQFFAAGGSCDFIPLHLYASSNWSTMDSQVLALFSVWINPIWNKYHLPIWLTEAGAINTGTGGTNYSTWTFPTATQYADFLTSLMKYARQNGNVERVSPYPNVFAPLWMVGPADPSGVLLGNASDGSLTANGLLYRSLDKAPANDVPSTTWAQVFVLPHEEQRRRRRVRRPYSRMRRAA